MSPFILPPFCATYLTLSANGVKESQVVVINVKIANDPYYKLGLGTGPEASVNRKTVIVDLSSEFGRRQLLLAQQ